MISLRFRIDRIAEGSGVFPGVKTSERTFDVHAVLVDATGTALRDGEFRVRLTPSELVATGWKADSIVIVPVSDEDPIEAAKVIEALRVVKG